MFDREFQLLHGADVGGNDPKDEFIAQALANDGSAVTSHFIRIGKINITDPIEVLPLLFVQEGPGELFGLFVSKWLVSVPDWLEGAVSSPSRGISGWEMDIGAIIFDSNLQILVDVREDFVF
jgi:hypothetical protein